MVRISSICRGVGSICLCEISVVLIVIVVIIVVSVLGSCSSSGSRFSVVLVRF